MAVELIFGKPPNTTLPLVLIFNEQDGGPAPDPDVEVLLAAVVTGVTATIDIGAEIELDLVSTVTALTVDIGITYFSDTQRPLAGEVRAHWQDADPLDQGFRQGWQDAVSQPSELTGRYQQAQPLPAGFQALWQDAQRLPQALRGRYQRGIAAQSGFTGGWQDGTPAANTTRGRYQEALRTGAGAVGAPFQQGVPAARVVRSHYQEALQLVNGLRSGFQQGISVDNLYRSHWQDAMRPPAGMWVRPNPEPEDPCYIPTTPVVLVFSEPGLNGVLPPLVFFCERHGGVTPPGPGIVIPVKEVYYMHNEIDLVRVADGKRIHATSFTLKLDYASWTWSFGADIPQADLADVRRTSPGVPVELLATVNGHSVKVAVDDVSQDRTYKTRDVRITGRGISAVLSNYVHTFTPSGAFDANQLPGQILRINGVSMGWGIDWQMYNWAVPANTWSVRGTYADMLNQLAAAAGGYVQPHATDKALRFLRKYPVAPRDWGDVTGYTQLPSDFATNEGTTWIDKPMYNRVFIEGQRNGIRVPATTVGTTGDLLADPEVVVDPLITAVNAGRGRAESILYDVGAQAMVRLRTPIPEELGFVTPGTFVKYVDGSVEQMGLTRALQIDANIRESWQTFEVETHV